MVLLLLLHDVVGVDPGGVDLAVGVVVVRYVDDGNGRNHMR